MLANTCLKEEKKMTKTTDKKTFFKKVIITLISVLFMGITLSILKIINWGMDSFSHMNVSIANTIGWSLGNWQILLNILMFIPVIIWGRKQIGIGTVFNMVLIGYTVDFCSWLWDMLNVASWLNHIVVRVIVMLITVVVFVIAAATYMSSELGTAPFDALPMMISEKLPKVPFKVVRFVWDLIAVLIGFVLSGKVGIVTILMVLFLGQTVELVRKKMMRE